MRFGRGQSVVVPKHHRLPVSFSTSLPHVFGSIIADNERSSDFENKFVCGEIMSYTDLHELGSEAAVKAAGKLRQQGKPYESTHPSYLSMCATSKLPTVVDGDIAYWKSGA